MRPTVPVLLLLAIATLPLRAAAQDRPFVFSITTARDASTPALRFDIDVGIGESAFHSDPGTGPEQRFSIQATTSRVTFVGRVGISSFSGDSQTWQEGDLLYSLTSGRAPVSVAAGGGVQREVDGTMVLMAEAVAGRFTSSTSTTANLLLQHADAPGRDALDVILSAGWAHRVGRGVSLGAEAIGEDLEGFWNPAEAEGGSRLLAGPSVHLALPGRKWQVSAVGGPIFHPNGSGRSTGAIRELPPDYARTGYALQVGVNYAIF